MVAIYPIVEGHGEVQAVPLLLRRIVQEIHGEYVQVLTPHRVPRGKMLAEASQDLDNAIELGVRKLKRTGGKGAILVLLDADDDCPATLGPKLLKEHSRDDAIVAVELAKREYEAWFLAATNSLIDKGFARPGAKPPASPESIRDAKGLLENEILREGAVYRETVDQPSLTSAFDLEEARVASSFDKLCRDIEGLIEQ